MSKVVQLAGNHPLVGTWTGEGDDARAEYTVTRKGNSFAIEGVDGLDGERFQISDVRWDGAELTFASTMPSTGRVVKHVFRAMSASSIKHSYTLTDTEVWTRKA